MFIIDEANLSASLDHLLEMAARGRSTVVTRNNQPIAVLAPYDGRLEVRPRVAPTVDQEGR